MSLASQPAHPDPKRIAGYTFALAFNLSLLMLLLAPMQGGPGPRQAADEPPSIAWYMPRTPPPALPPTVPVTRPVLQPSAVPPTPTVARQPEAPAMVVESGSEAADVVDAPAETETPAAAATGDIAPPVAGVTLQYAAAPPPAYPSAARRLHLEGTVLLEVLVDANGRPLRVDVRRSSGHRQLDEAARDQVLARWRFQPAMRDGRAIQAIGLVPVDFRLR